MLFRNVPTKISGCRLLLCDSAFVSVFTHFLNYISVSTLTGTMFSLSSMRPGLVHSVVDALFEGKKAQMKAQVNNFLDGLFDQLKSEVKEMLVPVQDEPIDNEASPENAITPQSKCSSATNAIAESSNLTFNTASKSIPPSQSTFKSKVKSSSTLNVQRANSSVAQGKIYAVKSSSAGVKRPLEHVPTFATFQVTDQTKVDIISSSTNNDSGLCIEDDHMSESSPEKKPKTNENVGLSLGEDTIRTIDGGDSNVIPDSKMPGKFVCQIDDCNKRFDRIGKLKRHERSHLGLKPFHCKWTGCSHASGDRDNVISHIRKVHLKQTSKPSDGDNEEPPDQDPKTYLGVDHDLLK